MRQQIVDLKTCLYFNGSSYVQIPNASSFQFGLGSFSINAWVKGVPNGTGASSIFGCNLATNNARYVLAVNCTTGLLTALVEDKSNNLINPASLGTNILDNHWHMATMTVDRTNNLLTIYRDAVQIYQASISSITDTVSPLGNPLIGQQINGAAANLLGYEDEIKLYSGVLSAQDVKDLFTHFSTQSSEGNLKAYYKFDEMLGSSVLDSSGNGNTGTITGAVYSPHVKSRPRMRIKGLSNSLKFLSTTSKGAISGITQSGNQLTLSGWSYLTNTTAAHNCLYGAINALRLLIDPGVAIGGFAGVWIGGTEYSVNIPAGLNNVNQWVHWIMTRNGDSLSVYRNGILVAQRTGLGTTANDSLTANIGQYGAGAYWFNGALADIALSNTAVTDAQARQLYLQQNPETLPSLLAHWRLDDGSGTTAKDSSGNGNDATLTNIAWSSNVPMKARTAATHRLVIQPFTASLKLSGSNNVSVPDAVSLDITPAVTMTAWVNILTLPSSFNYIIDKGTVRYGMYLNGSGQLVLAINNTSLWSASATHVPRNTWTHVAVTYDGANANYYINGVLDKTVAGVATIGTDSGALTMGSGDGSHNFLLAHVKVYAKTLTSTQILADMNGVTSGPVGYWKLGEGSGTTAIDSSGNGNNGTITGGTYSTNVPMKERASVS